MIYVVDTHALVWSVEGNDRLSHFAKDALNDPAAEIVVPTIVLVEIIYLYTKKRIKTNLMQVTAQIAGAQNCVVYPLDEEVLNHIPTDLNIHDAILCATALVFRDILGNEVKIITKDKEIINSGTVETLW